MNDVMKAIKNRRSIRKYKGEQIGDAELQAIMEAHIRTQRHEPAEMAFYGDTEPGNPC